METDFGKSFNNERSVRRRIELKASRQSLNNDTVLHERIVFAPHLDTKVLKNEGRFEIATCTV